MADEFITQTGATSITDGEDVYLPDPWGRFTVPGPLAADLLRSGWHVWTADDAPALGPWVDLLPDVADIDVETGFPCFVNASAMEGLPTSLRYRTVGATQFEIGGAMLYTSGPVIPDDLAVPDLYTTITALPGASAPTSSPVLLGVAIDLGTGAEDFAGLYLTTDENDDDVSIGIGAGGQALVVLTNTVWDVAP